MFSSLFKRRGDASYAAVIDIGSGSVGIGIVCSDVGTQTPYVLYTHRERMRIGNQMSPRERVRAMREALFGAALAFSGDGIRVLHAHDPRAVIDNVCVVCAAPWSKTATQTVRLEKEKPFTVTRTWIADIVEKARKQNPITTKETAILKDLGMTVVDKSVVDIRLNGYATNDPYRKTARELHVAYLSGLVSEQVLDAIKEIETQVISHAQQRTYTYALVLYSVLRDLYPDTKHALIMDVTGEATELCIMEDGILYDSVTVPYGAFTLARSLAKKLNTVPEEARAHLARHADTQTKTVQDACGAVAEAFATELQNAFTELAETYVLPQKIYLTVDPELETFVHGVCAQLKDRLPHRRSQSVIALSAKPAEQLARYAEQADRDIFLSIPAYFFHKLHTQDEIEVSLSSDILRT